MAGDGEGAVGLTMLMVVVVVVADVVCTVMHAVGVAIPVPHTAVVVAELRGGLTVVVVGAAVVVGAGVTAGEVEDTVFITELTLLDWLDITILD